MHFIICIEFFFSFRTHRRPWYTTDINTWISPQLYPLWFMLAHRVLLLASSLRSVIVSSPNDAVDPSLVWTHSSWPENNMFIQMFFSKNTLVKCEHESGHKQGPETKKDSAWAFLYRHPLRCVFGSVSTKSRCFLQFTQVAFCLLPTWKEKASICQGHIEKTDSVVFLRSNNGLVCRGVFLDDYSGSDPEPAVKTHYFSTASMIRGEGLQATSSVTHNFFRSHRIGGFGLASVAHDWLARPSSELGRLNMSGRAKQW